MNKILNLFNEEYVVNLFTKKILPLYPDFKSIKKIKIHAYKKNIWEKTYHVVIKFSTFFITKENKIINLPIICSAHSDEPRKNVYTALNFLWNNNFSKGYFTVPHPLFYSKKFQGTFYRGIEGNNLYHYIRENRQEEINLIIPKTALWFVKLHNTSINEAKNFNKSNSRIETVFPGTEHLFQKIKEKYPYYFDFIKNTYKKLIETEKNFLSSTSQRWLVHGDAHPENIIKMGKKKIGVIDFTDLCLSDFTRDLGTFLQQLEFMCGRKIKNKKYIEKIKNLFLETYLAKQKIKLDDNLQKRINNYYNWTAMRTATFFLLKSNPEPNRADKIIKKMINI